MTLRDLYLVVSDWVREFFHVYTNPSEWLDSPIFLVLLSAGLYIFLIGTLSAYIFGFLADSIAFISSREKGKWVKFSLSPIMIWVWLSISALIPLFAINFLIKIDVLEPFNSSPYESLFWLGYFLISIVLASVWFNFLSNAKKRIEEES